MPLKNYTFKDRRVIMHIDARSCVSAIEVMDSPLFREVMEKFCGEIIKNGSDLLSLFNKTQRKNLCGTITSALGMLLYMKPDRIAQKDPALSGIFKKPHIFHEFMQELYDYWRNLERFLIYSDEPGGKEIDHSRFIRINEDLKSSIIDAYRNIVWNLVGEITRVYRQLPAGANIGLLTKQIKWDCPAQYKILKGIPFIQLSMLEPPVIFYPKRNTRMGSFVPKKEFSLKGMKIDTREWLCYPAKVGRLTIFIFFHQEYISLGSSLANLFDLSTGAEIRKRPDGILMFGLPPKQMGKEQTIFFEDFRNKIVAGAIGKSEDVDYFGYFKKMALTIHNVIMMRRGRMPIHGAMAQIIFRNGKTANIVIVGDSGAGKSESLEAFRTLARKYIKKMNIIFDDMGSLQIGKDGEVLCFGTEIGAFVRLDDLQPGYAFGQIDRSLFMNPHKINARVVIPITSYANIIKGLRADLFLYANNYEDVDKEHPFVEIFGSEERALEVFRKSLRAAKGTTDETGLVGTYFANPFGPAQLKNAHEPLAKKYFRALFRSGTKVGQLRTRLGIKGHEQKGPETAARALFEFISTS